MRLSFFIMILVLGIIFNSCKKGTSDDPNREPGLISLELELGGSVFNTDINGNIISLQRDFPSGTMEVKIKSISLSDNNTSTSQAGDKLTIDMSPVSVTVKNSISKKELVYTLNLTTKSYSSIVEKNGLLRVSGNKIVNKNGVPVSFAGNSFFWSNNGWGGDKFYNASVVSWLKLDWETTLIRASMGVDETGGYIQFKTANTDKVKTLVDAAISNGLYVLIDWHSHHAEDYQPEAIEFFTEMATLYGNTDNVIYEIYNEPLDISWSSTLKPYAEAVITAIRAVDPDNMIVVGTPEWSQQVDKPAADPITISSNIAYALHFYSVYHKQWLRDRASAALNSGIALFATEWGSLGYTQNDPEAQLWMEWCRTNKISHCNWAVNDKAEEWSVVKPGASVTGGWLELTEAGYLARDIIRAWEQ